MRPLKIKFLWSAVFALFTQRYSTVTLTRLFSQKNSMDDKNIKLPSRPQSPSDEDCCNSACELCVKDIYQQELKIWEAECERMLLKEAPASTLNPSSYTQCKITQVKQITHNTKLFTFDCRGYVKILPGQHMILRERAGSVNVTRQYTPIVVPTSSNFTFTVMIKLYEEGIMSQAIAQRWCVDYEAEWRGPYGLFLHDENRYMKYVMVAAGTGIAPMLRIASQIVENENDITTIKLLYGCCTYDQILRKETIKMLCQHWNFSCKYFLSDDDELEKKLAYGDNAVSRRIMVDDLRNEIVKPASTRVLVCGTRQFDSSILGFLSEIGVPPDNIHKF